MAAPIWVVDTSALIQIKSTIPRNRRAQVFSALAAMVAEGRLRFPGQVFRNSNAILKETHRIRLVRGL